MAIKKIEEVYLYVADAGANTAENIEAMAFMDRCGIPYIRMFYQDASQSQQVIDALNTWWGNRDFQPLPPLTKFPFVIYTEVHDDRPARQSPVMYLEGLENLKKIVDIYNAAPEK